MEDNTQYLKDMADAEKRRKQTELDQARAEAQLQLQSEQQKAKPIYNAQRQNANAQSQLGARNLAEFWASRGQTSQGISAQAELSRNNTLNRNIGDINSQENSFNTQLQDQYSATDRNLNNQLLNANSNIDANLTTNLYNEKLRQQQIAEQKQKEALAYQQWLDEFNYKKQQDSINNSQEWSRINNSNTTKESKVLKGVLIPHDYAVQNQVKGVPVDANIMRYQVGNDFVEMPKGTNPFTGTTNKDLLNFDGKLDLTKAFSNTYQPNNVGGQKLAKTKVQANINGQTQNVWTTSTTTKSGFLGTGSTTTNTYYVWDGSSNKYVKLNSNEKKALGLK